MKKKVLVLNEGKPTKEFRPSKGEYRKQLKHFEAQGYEIIQKNINDPETEIPSILEALEDDSLAFVWPRMHGAPKSMTAAQGKEITSENLQKIFALLPGKLMSNAIIFLDSCSTGKLIKDFYNNIQFTFAKLTLELPHVQIIAPSENMAIYRFAFDEGIFRCNMASHPRGSQDIAITIGAKTKKLISKVYREASGTIEGSEVLLLESIIKNEGNYSSSAYYSIKQNIVLDSEYNTSKMLKISIGNKDFQSVKTLVEKYFVPLNSEDGDRYLWNYETPLTFAFQQIQYANFLKDKESLINIVKYLISMGADPLLELSDVRINSRTTDLLYKFAIKDNMSGEILEACAEVLLHQKNRLDKFVVLDKQGVALELIKGYLFGDFFGEVEQYGITQQMATLSSELAGQESDDDAPLVWGL